MLISIPLSHTVGSLRSSTTNRLWPTVLCDPCIDVLAEERVVDEATPANDGEMRHP
jgi:hypothetical protein